LADYLAGQDAQLRDAVNGALMLSGKQADQFIIGAIADNDARLARLVEDNITDPVAAERDSARFKTEFAKGLLDARAQMITERFINQARADVELGDKMFAGFMDDPSIAADVKDKVKQDYRSARGALQEERGALFADESAQLSAAISRGLHGPEGEAHVRDLYRRGGISRDEYQGFLSHMANNEDAAIKGGLDIARVQEVMDSPDGSRGLDPAHPKDKAAVDAWFKLNTAGIPQGSERWQAAAVYTAQKTNVLPESVDSWARTGMLSDNQLMAAQSAAFVNRVVTIAPKAWDYNADPKINSFMRMTNANLEAGLSPQEAAGNARRLVYEMPDNVRKTLEQQYVANKGAYPKGNQRYLESTIGGDAKFRIPESGFFGSVFGATDPIKVPNQMAIEFSALVSDYYTLNNGDIAAARRTAADHLSSIWGVTRMNGVPELMKYAPEAQYPNLTPEGIVTHKVEELTRLGYTGDPGKVRIIELPGETARTEGKKWGLGVVRPDGGQDMLLDPRNNMPLAFVLPLDIDMRRNEADKAKAVGLEQAAEARKQRLQMGDPIAYDALSQSNY
jgi:hypothetical protein